MRALSSTVPGPGRTVAEKEYTPPMKRREAREQEQADARERADRHREELIGRLRGDSATLTQPDEEPPAEAPPTGEAETSQEDAMSDKTPKRPPKKKKPKA